MRWAVLVALAACGDPPALTLKYTLTTDKAQLCYANVTTQQVARDCSEVPMPCPAVLSVRILSPADPTVPFVSVCEPIVAGRMDLCSIDTIDLPAPATRITSQTLEVQVAVYADADLMHDPNDPSIPICEPAMFAPNNLPESIFPSPAMGGRAFYHPGDATTVVALGCTDQAAVQTQCLGENSVTVHASVLDFDAEVAVPSSLADQLSVLFGEPQSVTIGTKTEYALSPADVHELARNPASTPPSWTGSFQEKLVQSACLEVLEDVAQATPSVVCKPVAAGAQQVDITGVRLAKSTLDQILAALHDTTFPPEGLVVGVVLDALGNPVEFASVTTDDTNPMTQVYYLNETRQSIQAGGTSKNGIFMSNAKYGTIFTAKPMMSVNESATGYGGEIEGKVSIVVLAL